ncbi:MAG: acyltransferase [Candidatus Omnitrophota bacterium]|nr:acyltransferase [Candidatus Omnitrophota bacterium]
MIKRGQNNIHVKVKLGKGCAIDKAALIGAVPIRKIKNLHVVIGNNAVCLYGGIVYLGTKIGDNLILGHYAIIREENIIGDNFKMWSNSVIDYGCVIGDNVKVHSNCYIAQFSRIENNCFIAPGVVLANDRHPGCVFSQKCLKGVVLRKNVQVGCNVTILPGVTVGEGSIIGAGSVVVKDVPALKVICGNPARVIKRVSDIQCLLFPGQTYITRVQDHKQAVSRKCRTKKI